MSPNRTASTVSLSPARVPDVDPIDAAAHLQLLGESLSLIGHRLQETEVNFNVYVYVYCSFDINKRLLMNHIFDSGECWDEANAGERGKKKHHYVWVLIDISTVANLTLC